MKLAEALQERADLNRNIEQLKNRLSSNALVQEGEQPVECPENLKQELDASISRLSYLIARINRTNCQTVVEGQTLTELIAQKDALSSNSMYTGMLCTREVRYPTAPEIRRSRSGLRSLWRTGKRRSTGCPKNCAGWITGCKRATGRPT